MSNSKKKKKISGCYRTENRSRILIFKLKLSSRLPAEPCGVVDVTSLIRDRGGDKKRLNSGFTESARKRPSSSVEKEKKKSLIVLSGPLPNCNIHIKTLLKLVKTLQTVTLVNNHVLVSYINNSLFTHNHRQLIRNSVFSFAVFVLSSTSALSSHCSPL